MLNLSQMGWVLLIGARGKGGVIHFTEEVTGECDNNKKDHTPRASLVPATACTGYKGLYPLPCADAGYAGELMETFHTGKKNHWFIGQLFLRLKPFVLCVNQTTLAMKL